MRNKKRKAGGNNRLLVSLFLSGHTLGLAPTGIQFHTLATEFDGFVSAYTNIILFLSLQLAHTLRGGAVLADGNGLVVFLKVLVCAVLHLITCGLGFLLFPSDLKAFFDSFHLRHAGAFWIDIVGQALCTAGGAHCTGELLRGECGLHLRAQGRQKLSHGNKG